MAITHQQEQYQNIYMPETPETASSKHQQPFRGNVYQQRGQPTMNDEPPRTLQSDPLMQQLEMMR